MAASLAGVSLSAASAAAKADAHPRSPATFMNPRLAVPWNETSRSSGRLRLALASASSTPKEIADKVEESIKNAEEACAGDPTTGECAAAWDEVEEVSAAASHLRARQKESDPLESYCKDNPETEECKTFDS